jgi:hypothetical protein
MTKLKALSRRAAMARGALMGALKPTMLAADAKLDYGVLLEGVTSKNWKESKPKIIAGIKPKLAADADLQDVVKLLDTLDGVPGMDDDPETTPPPVADADPIADILAMCKGKLSDDELTAMGEKLKALKPAAAADVDPPEPKPTPEPAKGETVSKTAMDAALKKAAEDSAAAIKLARDEAEKNTMARLNAIREAETVVHPFVGKLVGAFDSGEAVYRAALTNLGVKHEDIHASALRAVLEAQPKAGSKTELASDARPEGLETRFPGIAGMRVIG